MDNLKDKGWESMRQILDREMPQTPRRRVIVWRWSLAILAVASFIGGLLLLNNFYGPPSTWINQADMANDAPVYTNDAAINANDASVDAAADNEKLTPFIEGENSVEGKGFNTGESKGIDLRKQGDRKQVLDALTVKSYRKARDVEKSDAPYNYVPVGNIAHPAEMQPGTSQISLTEVDHETVQHEEATDETNVSSGKTASSQGLLVQTTDDMPVSRELLTAWDELPTKEPHLVSDINRRPNTIIFEGVQKLNNRRSFQLTSGAYMEANKQYGGVFIMPEFRWRLPNRISLGAGINARYRNTRSDFILANAFAESQFSDALGVTNSYEFLDLKDVSTASVNRSSLDLGLQGSLVAHLGARLRVGADVGLRFNNVLNTKPITQVVLQSGEKYSSASNTSGNFMDPTVHAGILIEYATGKHGAIQFGTSYQMGQKFQNQLPLEMRVGYSLRLF